MSESLKEQIFNGMMRYSKEQLIQMLDDHDRRHNEFCKQANTWRVGMAMALRALKPFADAADELDGDHHDALQVGGFVPTTEEWATTVLPTKLIYDAREVCARKTPEHVAHLNDEMDAARMCIEALKELEQQGNTLAAQTLTKVRQVDPYV